MNKIWYNAGDLIVDNIGAVRCPDCPCVDVQSSGEPPVQPPEGWCEGELDPVCPTFPIRTTIPGLNEWDLSFDHSPFDVVTVSATQLILESVNTFAPASQMDATLNFQMRLPYHFLTRLQVNISTFAERVSGTQVNFRTMHSFLDLIPSGLLMRRHFSVTSGASDTRHSNMDYFTEPGGPDYVCGPISKDEGADGSPYRIDYDYSSPTGPLSGDGHMGCTFFSSCCLDLYISLSHFHPGAAGGSRFRTTTTVSFNIEGSNTPP